MWLSIRTKFLLLVGLLMFVIFGAITLSLIQSGTKALRQDLHEESKAFASLATQPIGNTVAIYMDSGTSKIDEQIKQFVELNKNITNIAVVNVDGKLVYSQSTKNAPIVNSSEASSFDPIFRNNSGGALGMIIYPYFEASGAHRFSVVYTVSDSEIEKAVRDEAMSLLYFGLASLLATMALTYLLINRLIIKPVRQVSSQASLISAGNLEQEIAVHGHDEIASLGESVNRMADSLKANISKLKEVDKVKSEFMMITSHNLRTPLTIISGYLDNMKLIAGDTEKLESALARIGSSVKRLETFAEDILTISRFELGDTQLQSSEVRLDEFMGRIVSEFSPTAELKKISFVAEIQDGGTQLRISAPFIHSAIWNILDNAAKFTKEGGKITLATKRNGDSLQIIISDNGIGITAAELPKLFTKFHRGTSTLTYDFEGTGIGLYASKVMVEKHGGTITVNSEEGRGSTFTINLPIFSSSSQPRDS